MDDVSEWKIKEFLNVEWSKYESIKYNIKIEKNKRQN